MRTETGGIAEEAEAVIESRLVDQEAEAEAGIEEGTVQDPAIDEEAIANDLDPAAATETDEEIVPVLETGVEVTGTAHDLVAEIEGIETETIEAPAQQSGI